MAENKEYTKENASPEEVESLRENVFFLEEDIIYFRELPVMSEFGIEVMWGKVNELIKPGKKYYLIIDLVGSKPPGANLRGPLKEWMNKVSSGIHGAYVFTEKNKLINLVAKFVLSGSGFPEFIIHKTKEEALATLRDRKANS